MTWLEGTSRRQQWTGPVMWARHLWHGQHLPDPPVCRGPGLSGFSDEGARWPSPCFYAALPCAQGGRSGVQMAKSFMKAAPSVSLHQVIVQTRKSVADKSQTMSSILHVHVPPSPSNVKQSKTHKEAATTTSPTHTLQNPALSWISAHKSCTQTSHWGIYIYIYIYLGDPE